MIILLIIYHSFQTISKSCGEKGHFWDFDIEHSIVSINEMLSFSAASYVWSFQRISTTTLIVAETHLTADTLSQEQLFTSVYNTL